MLTYSIDTEDGRFWISKHRGVWGVSYFPRSKASFQWLGVFTTEANAIAAAATHQVNTWMGA